MDGSPRYWRGQRRARRAAALIAAVVLAAGGATAPATSAAQIPTDDVLADRVYVALNRDPIYFFRHVDVNVSDGVVDLSGYVWTADAIYRARQIARDVPGIRKVVTSHLELERNGSTRGSTR